MKKKLAMILIVLLIGMSVLPTGAVFAENGTTVQTEGQNNNDQGGDDQKNAGDTATQNGNGESAASAQNARDKNIFNTGTDPLWSFVDIDVPEQALVGQEFEMNITVKNMGTGSGMFPEFRFTEESERKALSHFTVVSGTDGVYDTMLTEVKGGETKTFTIKMKVNPETKELPEGSKYRINCMIASDNWQVKGEKRYNAVQSFDLEVVYALSDPSFVVEKVTFNPAVTAGVKETTATLVLKNISQSKANNVTATLEGSYITNGGESNSGEKNITVRDLSSTKQLYNIKGNQTVTVDYKLELNEDRKNNEMKLTIDYNGAEKPQEILLNMPLPLQENKGGKEPKVIIQRYNVDPSKVLAGNYVTLNLFVENTNNLAVNNVSIQLDVPTETSSSGGTVSSGTVFSPVDSSNTFYIDRIEGKQTALKTISMYVDPNATAKTYVVPVNIKYESTDGTKYESSDNVNIPVTQESKIEIISSNIPTMGNVGEPINVSMEFVNVGKVNLTNFKVRMEGDIPGKEENVFYLGTFNASESNEYSATIIPEEEGVLSGSVAMSYIDADNQEVSMEIPFSIEIGPAIDYGDMTEPMEPIPEPGLLDKLKQHWLPIVLGIVIVVQAIILIRIKRKAKAEEELIDG